MMGPMADRKSPSGPGKFVCAGIDTAAGNPFVQARLALLGKTVFLLSFGFFVIMNGMLLLGGGLGVLPMLANRTSLGHFLASSVMGILWLVASARPLALRKLGVLDAMSLFLGGVMLALMAAQRDEKQLVAGVFALSVTMMARAVLIPSTAKRTLLLSSIASTPLLVVSVVFHEPCLLYTSPSPRD